MGSPWSVPFSKLKYGVVKPPFITHNCWLFDNNFIQCMKFSPKANSFKTLYRKSWFKESNAFLISIVTRISSISHISITSEINLSYTHTYIPYHTIPYHTIPYHT